MAMDSKERVLIEWVRRMKPGEVFRTDEMAAKVRLESRRAGYLVSRSKLAEHVKPGLWRRTADAVPVEKPGKVPLSKRPDLGPVANLAVIGEARTTRAQRSYDFAPELMPKAGAR